MNNYSNNFWRHVMYRILSAMDTNQNPKFDIRCEAVDIYLHIVNSCRIGVKIVELEKKT